jgi:hypothetical protein
MPSSHSKVGTAGSGQFATSRSSFMAGSLFGQSFPPGLGDLHPEDDFFSAGNSVDAWLQHRKLTKDQRIDVILADAMG